MTRSRTSLRFRLLSALTCLLLAAGSAHAQPAPLGRYGNEWIQAGQPYYKLEVGQRGIHRLTSAWLAAAGVPTTTLDPHRLQLWRRGQEQAIYVAGEGDGRLDATDYVDFWGMPNDGRLDAELYKDPTDQASQLLPLYTDTAAYFLTIVPFGTPVRRMTELSSNPAGLTPVLHHVAQVQKLATEEVNAQGNRVALYERGREYDDHQTAMPWLDETEGFMSPYFAYRNGQARDLALTMPTAPDTTHLIPQLDVMVVSVTYAPEPLLITILRGTGTTATVIRTTPLFPTVAPYGHQLLHVDLRYSDFSAGGVLSFRVGAATNPAGNSGYMSYVYARLAAAAPNTLGGQARLLLTDSTLNAPSQYLLFDAAPAAVVGYDVTDPNTPVRISGQAVGAQWGLVVPTPGPAPRRVFIADDATPRLPRAGRLVPMRILTPVPNAYLIVTGTALLTDTTGIHPVRDFAAYRASVPGGRYDTVTMVMDQLYDQFHYGDNSPNAIRRYVAFMSSGAAPPSNLFLLGRGFEPVQRGTVTTNRSLFSRSIVPAFGYPASDVVYTADFRNNQYVPRVPTGRLAARTAADVPPYLDKVRTHEAAPPADWRKEILHLGGGKSVYEQVEFRGYLNAYASRAEDSLYLGGHVTSILRGNTGQTVSQVNVSTQVNRGLALITFFGHSSALTSDIDIGLASDPLANYRNPGRYPMLLMNGCASGRVFFDGGTVRSFGEDWVLTPQRGALAFMAYNGAGLPGLLNDYSDAFYKAAFNDPLTYGTSVGRQQQRAIELATPNLTPHAELGIAQLVGMVLQSDPAARLYSPTQPDYFVADSTVKLLPLPGERLTARASGVQVMVRMRNYGKAIRDSVRIEVRRTFTNGTPAQVVQQVFAPVFFADTIMFTLPNPANAAAQGANTFEIFVDYPNAVAELNETNNRATIRYSFPSGSVFPLFPQEFAIVPTATPGLVGEYDQPLANNRDYTFELDTDPAFTSPTLVRQNVNAGRYPSWRPTLPPTTGQDSVVWYWRFRPLAIQLGEDSTWAASSFRHITASPGGWSQSHYGQFVRDRKTRLSQAVPSGRWNYSSALLRLLLRTHSGDSVAYQYGYSSAPTRTFETPPDGITFNQSSAMRGTLHVYYSTVFIMVFDPHTLEPVTNLDSIFVTSTGKRRPLADQSSVYGQGDPGSTTYTMWSALGTTLNQGTTPPSPMRVGLVIPPLDPSGVPSVSARADSVAKLIERVPDGYIVALVTGNRVPFDEMRANRPKMLQALRTIGSGLVDGLRSGDPLVIVGIKGSAPGTANEKTYDHSLPRRWGQTVIIDTVQRTNEPRGQVASTVIGPVQQWLDLVHTVKVESPTLRYQLTVVPIDPTGRDGTPIPVPVPTNPGPANSTSTFDLRTLINPVAFPKARLEMTSYDSTNRVAPQLKQWLVTYQGVPEGVVRTDLVPASQLDLTAQVDSGGGYVRVRLPFQNISTVTFRDSITVEFTILRGTTGGTTVVAGPLRVKMPALGPDQIGYATARFNIAGFASGDYTLHAVVNPSQLQPEQYDFNNLFDASFRVVNPNLAPLVDVAFDGQHILYGDIVAPAPVITVTVRDEDKRVPIDPARVTLVLTPTDPSGPVRSLLGSSPEVHVEPATATKPMMLTYEPGSLADGKYRLDVQATDPAGNLAATEPFKTEFRVINETMISNFYPYPNPFSTSTRFLFTITGRVPQRLKIQIMTVTGRVVREITKEELGTDLRVGNNTSTTTWNGTDEYGDQLANGVYLYRVVVQDDADNFKSFKTAGDSKAFHKTWGKLYILR